MQQTHTPFHITNKQRVEILHNSLVRVGFEAELILPLDSYGEHENQVEKTFHKQLINHVGSAATHWQLTPDGSIHADNHAPGTGIEVISQPAPIRDALKDLHALFALMIKQNIITNNTTGLHVGVSVQNASLANLNKLKLLLLLDEKFISDAFDRTLNTYTQSHVELLKKQIAQAKRKNRNWIRERDVQLLIKHIEKLIDNNKHRTVNFSKIAHGYLEFRIMGNKDYHLNYKKVEDVVIRYASVLLAALDTHAFEPAYQTQVARLIAQALNQAQPEFQDLTHKYAVLGAGRQTERNTNWYQRFHDTIAANNQKGAVVLLSQLIYAADKHADETHNPRLINAAALSYRIMLKKHLRMSIPQFAKAMATHHVQPCVIAKVIHYLKTY